MRGKTLFWAGMLLVQSLWGSLFAGEPRVLLPDLAVRRSDLFDNDIVTSISPGRTHLRVANGTPNIGEGKFHLVGQPPDDETQTQSVHQLVWSSDGTFTEREAGTFVYHQQHNHVHIESWAIYRLRAVLPGDGVGEIIAEGEKTSFCIIDLAVYDSSLPNHNPNPEFRQCASIVQGLSVGWVDIYHKSLAGQNIDITDVPSGVYWLESVVDPDDHFLELSEANNVERIQITIGNPSELLPDAFEPNDTIQEVEARPVGGFNSPNLGPVDPKQIIDGLTLHEPGNEDHFKFYSNHAGSSGDFVRIDFTAALGNLDLELLTDDGEFVASSTNNGSSEVISLDGLSEGWYVVKVFGKGDNNVHPAYALTVNPPTNETPNVTVQAPAEGDVVALQGLEAFTIEWTAGDPEDDLTWVTVYLNEQPILDGNEELLPTSLHTSGETGFHIVNSADVTAGTYWVYCSITDGGQTTGAWSEGTFTILAVPPECTTLLAEGKDCNDNGVIDSCDTSLGITDDCNFNSIPDSCDLDSGALVDKDGDGTADNCRIPFHRGDANGDGSIDVSDGVFELNFLFLGGTEPSCMESADANNDGDVDLSDAVTVLQFLFQGGSEPSPPGPPGFPCDVDKDPSDSAGNLGCEIYGNC